MSANIIEIFLRNARELADHPAIVDADGSVSYSRLADDVRRVARALELEGIAQGDHVLVFVPMSRQLYTLMLALFHIGATAVFVDAWADRGRMTLAARSVPLRAFIGVARAHVLRLLSKEIRAIPIKLVARVDRWKGDGREPTLASVDGEDAALVTFTTGSTGAPKGALRSHRFLVAQHRAIARSFGSARGDIDMPTLPIFVLNNLAAGATTVLPAFDPRRADDFDPEAVVERMNRARVTTTTGSPAFYERLAEHCLATGRALPNLERLYTGGAPVGPRLASLLMDAFPTTRVSAVYGSTEAEPISMIDARALVARAPTETGLPVGAPVDGVEVLIVPIVDGAITVASEEELRAMSLPPGETGEICVTGEHVLDRYYGEREAWMSSKIAAPSGDTVRLWHRTGDGGYLAADGSLSLMGRVRQSFERNGRRTFVLPVEQQLQQIEGVSIGTILIVDDEPVVVVAIEEDAVQEMVERMVRESGIDCDRVLFVDEMPRDPRHHSKIDYEKLRKSVRD